MAAITRVIAVDFESKRSLLLVRHERFLDIGVNVTKMNSDASKLVVECSANGTEWCLLSDDVMILPALQVMDGFGYKFVRFRVELPVPAVDADDSKSQQKTQRSNAFDVIMKSARKRRLPEKKTNRCVFREEFV